MKNFSIALACALLCADAAAQNYPVKPIRVISECVAGAGGGHLKGTIDGIGTMELNIVAET